MSTKMVINGAVMSESAYRTMIEAFKTHQSLLEATECDSELDELEEAHLAIISNMTEEIEDADEER